MKTLKSIIVEISEHQKYLKKHGIIPEKAKPDHCVCSIGFSEKEQKWYGWSPRAIYGFKIGDEVKEGDCAVGSNGIKIGFKIKSLEDAKKVAMAFAESVS